MSVSFPDVDTGQVGYNICPQFLVCSELKKMTASALHKRNELLREKVKLN